MGSHHEEVAGGVFFKDAVGRGVDPGGILDAEPDNLVLEHLLPFALAEDVQPPGPAQRFRDQRPGVQQAVEALLVVQAADGDHAMVARLVRDALRDGGVGDDGEVGQFAPHRGVLAREHHEAVEAPDNPLVHPGADAVHQAHQALAVVLQAEQLVEVQFQHLQATVLDVRDEGRFRREE